MANEIDEITDSVKNYINTNIELLKLETTERVSVVSSGLISNLIVAVLSFLGIIFFSIAIAFFIAERMNSFAMGFGIVAAFYVLVAIILWAKRKSFIEMPIRNSIIKSIFSNP